MHNLNVPTQIYSGDLLTKFTLQELKKHAANIGVIGVRQRNRKQSWIDAILEQQQRISPKKPPNITPIDWSIASDEEVFVAAAEAKRFLGV